jgi:hypothetical protein
MFYSFPLTMAAGAILVELGVRQLASRIPFEGVAQDDCVGTLRMMKICRRKVTICENQANHFYIESRSLKKL